MTVVVSLEDFRPAPRYDALPWTQARIEEAATAAGPWGTLETVALSPLDTDPANPRYRNFTTALGSAAEQWYRVVFLDAAAATGLPTVPIQNVEDDRPVYAAVSDLAVLVNVSATTRHDDLLRVLKAAAGEIDWFIGTADAYGAATPYSNPPALVREVNLERAVEHWVQSQSPYGPSILGLGEAGVVYSARDGWDRHAHKLSMLKNDWGLA